MHSLRSWGMQLARDFLWVRRPALLNKSVFRLPSSEASVYRLKNKKAR